MPRSNAARRAAAARSGEAWAGHPAVPRPRRVLRRPVLPRTTGGTTGTGGVIAVGMVAPAPYPVEGRCGYHAGSCGKQGGWPMDLAGKVILVVGGAAGIGAGTSRLCAERGASVIVADRDEAAGAGVAADCGGAFIPVDVADEASVKGMYARVAKAFGRLDVLLHVAGVLK